MNAIKLSLFLNSFNGLLNNAGSLINKPINEPLINDKPNVTPIAAICISA